MRSLPICYIGLDCPSHPCPNREYCKDQTYSWGLPYKIQNNALIVHFLPCRYRWSDAGTHPHRIINFCPLPSGQYLAIADPIEFKRNLKQAWKEAGWAEAEPLPNLENDDDFDIF